MLHIQSTLMLAVVNVFACKASQILNTVLSTSATYSEDIKYSMQLKALEEEVSCLSAEVTRLRLMVHRCCEEERHRQQLVSENTALKNALRNQQHAVPEPAALPQQPAPQFNYGLSANALPPIFCGVDGTARLFRAIMEAYPWLVPPEVKEAQEIVAQERLLQQEERRLRHERRVQRHQLELQAEAEESLIERRDMMLVAKSLAAAGGAQSGPVGSHDEDNKDKKANKAVSSAPVQDAAPTSVPHLNLGSATGLTPRLHQGTPVVQPLIQPLSQRSGTPLEMEELQQRSPAVPATGASVSPVTEGVLPSSAFAGSTTLKSAVSSSSNAMSATGVLLGRPPAKKAAGSTLLQKLKNGGASDSDDDYQQAAQPSGTRGSTPLVPPKSASADGDDDHDF